jgi:hypothetical protein
VVKASKFLISRPLYAVDLTTFELTGTGRSNIDAVWFRRRKGSTVACFGNVWNYLRPRPQTAEGFLAAHDDNRYGGDCAARWDGRELWSPGSDELERADCLALLRPMLENYPEVPPGYDGWWGFQ